MGGIKAGVLLGFWHGSMITDKHNYLTHGTNKQIFYTIFYSLDEIDENAIAKLLKEANKLDELGLKIKFKKIKSPVNGSLS